VCHTSKLEQDLRAQLGSDVVRGSSVQDLEKHACDVASHVRLIFAVLKHAKQEECCQTQQQYMRFLKTQGIRKAGFSRVTEWPCACAAVRSSPFAATIAMATPGGVSSRRGEPIAINAQEVLPPPELLHHTAGCFLDRGAMSTALHDVFDHTYKVFV
jgi:hypothetical protein